MNEEHDERGGIAVSPTKGIARTRPTMAVYIDGFNLYRRLLAGHHTEKWLDLEALARSAFPEHDLVSLRYFTAIIKPLPGKDPSSPQRQQAYLRALRASKKTSVHLGKFRIDPRVMPVHPTEFDAEGKPKTVKVKKTEEKGSDVALASYLLTDAFHRRADLYVVCTNDSDLVAPLNLLTSDLGAEFALLSPMEVKRAINELKQTGPLYHVQITPAMLRSCQLPAEIEDEHGVVRRPAGWG